MSEKLRFYNTDHQRAIPTFFGFKFYVFSQRALFSPAYQILR